MYQGRRRLIDKQKERKGGKRVGGKELFKYRVMEDKEE